MRPKNKRDSTWRGGLLESERHWGPGNPYGVVGFGIGKRRVGLRATKQRALVVYVQTKQTKPFLALPPISVRDASIATGHTSDGNLAGDVWRGVVPNGLGSGAPLRIQVGNVMDSVACLLGDYDGRRERASPPCGASLSASVELLSCCIAHVVRGATCGDSSRRRGAIYDAGFP